MSGVWGAEGPRCQAALTVLASLCRARPPPLGLDVETCRSFELQPPEQSPSAANSGSPQGRSTRAVEKETSWLRSSLSAPGITGSRVLQ
ncbi:Synaptotagmin-6 [Microtus ochrogaster]|uniref:Synaptotagmin-6 n=1 Tax=Microtus ochrogaster TaxID=79684 RepID=A0A8J6KTE2_MICOH|nr:Synaptotagmin-6 [Microtus ochrogaster]